MTRKPRRHALTVPVRSGSEVGFPQSLGEVHDMLYDKSLERDNCGFGLIAHIEGEPSHKVVRTAIHALARMQHRGAILADGKTGDGCGLLLQKPDRFFRIVAQERGWRLAKNYAVGMLFLNKDPELAAAARRIVEEELQRETLSIVGWRDVPTNEGVLGEIALSSLPRIEQIFVNAPAGWRPRSAVCLSPAAALKSVSKPTKTSTSVACRIWSIFIKVCVCRRICRASTWTSLTCVWNRPSACFTSAFPLTPYRAGRWRSHSATSRITVKSTPSPVTANGRVRVPINSRRR